MIECTAGGTTQALVKVGSSLGLAVTVALSPPVLPEGSPGQVVVPDVVAADPPSQGTSPSAATANVAGSEGSASPAPLVDTVVSDGQDEPEASGALYDPAQAPPPVLNRPAPVIASPWDLPDAPRAPQPPEVARDGRGMVIAGGIVGGVGLLMRISFARLAGREFTEFGSPLDLGPLGIVVGPPMHHTMLATGLGLVGGGMWRRGRWAADQSMFRGRERRARPMPGLGWGLFGAGAALWGITRVAWAACDDAECGAATKAGGLYGGLVLASVGLPVGAWATGYRRYTERHGAPDRALSVAPTAVGISRAPGLSVAGRF